MPAPPPPASGVKLVTLSHENPRRGLPLIHGVYVLFAPDTLAPGALLDGAALTALRTAAVSALATRHLARPAARRLVVFGAGTQARAHVAAHARRADAGARDDRRARQARAAALVGGAARGRPARDATGDRGPRRRHRLHVHDQPDADLRGALVPPGPT